MTTDAPFYVWETLLYAFLNSFPYMMLVLFSFRKRWRFGKPATFSLLALVTVLITLGTAWRLFLQTPGNPLFDVVFSLLYIVFIFLAIREPVGKLVFTVLVLMNLGNLVIMVAKCLEGLLFGELAQLRYHWTYAMMMFAVLCVLLPVFYLLIFKDIASDPDAPVKSVEPSSSGYMWRYLWLIPAVFYLIWTQHFYTSGKSSLETALDPFSTGYLLLIDLGSILIYRLIIRLVTLQQNNEQLQTENHALTLQKMQYSNLQQRIDEVRQARHDLRHHIILLKGIRENEDLNALDELLAGYPSLESLENPLSYCDNETFNAIISYFAEQAAEICIDYTVKLDIPAQLFVEKADLTVLLGNLLENAMEACAYVESGAFIRVTSSTKNTPGGGKTLAIIIENSYGVEPQVREDGTFRSTKHKGEGIGIASVRRIAARYEGACSFLFKNGMFTASVLLNGSESV